MMLYGIISTEKCGNKYDSNHLIFLTKKSIEVLSAAARRPLIEAGTS